VIAAAKDSLARGTSLLALALTSRVAGVTAAHFVELLPNVIGGFTQYDAGVRALDPKWGTAMTPFPVTDCLSLVPAQPCSFSASPAFRLPAAAFASLLLSAPGLLLNFLVHLPLHYSEKTVTLRLPISCAGLAAVIERLFSLAGAGRVRFTQLGWEWLVLEANVYQLQKVVGLGGGFPGWDSAAGREAVKRLIKGNRLLQRPSAQAAFFWLPAQVPQIREFPREG
jgi:hypothetical protein